MSNNIEGIRAIIQTELRDETQEDFKPDDIDVVIKEIVKEVSKRSPLEDVEAITLTAGSLEYDVSDIEDLLEVEKAEYPTGCFPKRFVNVEQWGNTITLVCSSLPSGADAVNLYCRKIHTLDTTTNTLTPDLEDVVVKGVCARMARGWARRNFSRIVWGGNRTAADVLNWANEMKKSYEFDLKLITDQRITQPYYSTTSGRTEIGG